LLTAIDPAGDAFGYASSDVAVEADIAVARREFPSADAAIGEAERAVDLGPTPGRPRGIVGDGLSGQDPTVLEHSRR
jgi:hypothetical protein